VVRPEGTTGVGRRQLSAQSLAGVNGAPSGRPASAGACARVGDAAAEVAANDEITAAMKFPRFKAMCLSLRCCPLLGSRLHWFRMCREVERRCLRAT
jgi:hypothetical protein